MNWKHFWLALLFAGGLAIPRSGWAGAATNSLAARVAAIDHDRILRLADQAMMLKPPAVTDQIATNSAGGPHDFFSQADYFWPNPATPSGLPYVNRDGKSNPDTFTWHRTAMRQMKDAVAALAAAYALTGDDRYATKAAEFLRVFFIDGPTRMYPSLQYAQAVLGSSTGRSYGIIDTLHLSELPPAILALERSPAFPPAVDFAMKQWFAQYTHWIMTATNGVTEMDSANNHSIACFVQLASFAKLTGDEAVLALARQRFKDVLLPKQMTTNGSFPLELKRTKPYGYSIFQADNVSILCHLLSTTNDDLWNFTLPDGATPRKAVDFIYPYLADKNQWLADGRGQDVMHWDEWPVRQVCLLFAYAEFGDEKYFTLWQKLNPDPADLEVRRNLAVTQPLLWVVKPMEIPLNPVARANLDLANTYKTNGVAYFEFSQWTLAISNLEKCVSIETNDIMAYDAIAAACFVRGNVNDAIYNYSRELAIDPTRAMAHLNRGNALRSRGAFDAAITDFTDCLRLNLTNAMVYKLRASVWYEKHDYDREISDLTAALALHPFDAGTFVMRADAYVKQGKFKPALADYQQAIIIDPKDADAANDFAWMRATCTQADIRDGAAAVTAATQACEATQWGDWAFIDTLAAAYAEAGDFTSATKYERQAMSKVLSSDPSKKEMMQHELAFEMHQPWRE